MGLSNYIFNKKLGEGSFGVVYNATDRRTNRVVALKRVHVTKLIKESKTDLGTINNEIEILRKVAKDGGCDNNLACYYEHFYVKKPDDSLDLYIEMEFIDGPDLYDLYKKLERSGRKIDINLYVQIVRDLTRAVNFLHSNGIAHRDIKLENVIFDQKTKKVKLVDFGLSCRSKCTAGVGSMPYLPPEYHFGDDNINGFVMATRHDMWSLGVLFYEIGNLSLPFPVYTEGMTYDAYLNYKPFIYRSSLPSRNGVLSGVINHLIRKLLNHDYERRLEARHLEEYIEEETKGERIPILLKVKALGYHIDRPYNNMETLRDYYRQARVFPPTEDVIRDLTDDLNRYDNQNQIPLTVGPTQRSNSYYDRFSIGSVEKRDLTSS